MYYISYSHSLDSLTFNDDNSLNSTKLDTKSHHRSIAYIMSAKGSSNASNGLLNKRWISISDDQKSSFLNIPINNTFVQRKLVLPTEFQCNEIVLIPSPFLGPSIISYCKKDTYVIVYGSYLSSLHSFDNIELSNIVPIFDGSNTFMQFSNNYCTYNGYHGLIMKWKSTDNINYAIMTINSINKIKIKDLDMITNPDLPVANISCNNCLLYFLTSEGDLILLNLNDNTIKVRKKTPLNSTSNLFLKFYVHALENGPLVVTGIPREKENQNNTLIKSVTLFGFDPNNLNLLYEVANVGAYLWGSHLSNGCQELMLIPPCDVKRLCIKTFPGHIGACYTTHKDVEDTPIGCTLIQSLNSTAHYIKRPKQKWKSLLVGTFVNLMKSKVDNQKAKKKRKRNNEGDNTGVIDFESYSKEIMIDWKAKSAMADKTKTTSKTKIVESSESQEATELSSKQQTQVLNVIEHRLNAVKNSLCTSIEEAQSKHFQLQFLQKRIERYSYYCATATSPTPVSGGQDTTSLLLSTTKNQMSHFFSSSSDENSINFDKDYTSSATTCNINVDDTKRLIQHAEALVEGQRVYLVAKIINTTGKSLHDVHLSCSVASHNVNSQVHSRIRLHFIPSYVNTTSAHINLLSEGKSTTITTVLCLNNLAYQSQFNSRSDNSALLVIAVCWRDMAASSHFLMNDNNKSNVPCSQVEALLRLPLSLTQRHQWRGKYLLTHDSERGDLMKPVPLLTPMSALISNNRNNLLYHCPYLDLQLHHECNIGTNIGIDGMDQRVFSTNYALSYLLNQLQNVRCNNIRKIIYLPDTSSDIGSMISLSAFEDVAIMISLEESNKHDCTSIENGHHVIRMYASSYSSLGAALEDVKMLLPNGFNITKIKCNSNMRKLIERSTRSLIRELCLVAHAWREQILREYSIYQRGIIAMERNSNHDHDNHNNRNRNKNKNNNDSDESDEKLISIGCHLRLRRKSLKSLLYSQFHTDLLLTEVFIDRTQQI